MVLRNVRDKSADLGKMICFNRCPQNIHIGTVANTDTSWYAFLKSFMVTNTNHDFPKRIQTPPIQRNETHQMSSILSKSDTIVDIPGSRLRYWYIRWDIRDILLECSSICMLIGQTDAPRVLITILITMLLSCVLTHCSCCIDVWVHYCGYSIRILCEDYSVVSLHRYRQYFAFDITVWRIFRSFVRFWANIRAWILDAERHIFQIPCQWRCMSAESDIWPLFQILRFLCKL